ncbi:hypothetical protein CRUP_010015 [Coryphaenoides rupestris]|nr:hypothetical protein CRUP_010015 [Coryphaenoides rupestris]
MPEKSAALVKALVTPISCRLSPREDSAEMENLGRSSSTELQERPPRITIIMEVLPLYGSMMTVVWLSTSW